MTTIPPPSSTTHVPETMTELFQTYIPYNSAQYLISESQNKEDETVFCIYCNKYLPAFQICKVDCFSPESETGTIVKNEVRICDKCLREYQDSRKVTKLFVRDKVEGVEDLIYESVVGSYNNLNRNETFYETIRELFFQNQTVKDYFNGDICTINDTCRKLYPIRYRLSSSDKVK